MRILRSFKVDKTILQLFHRALVETVLTFSIVCWFSQLTIRERTKLQRVIFRSSKIAAIEFPPLDRIHLLHMERKTEAILTDPSHPLQPLLQPGKRYISVKARTKIYSEYFVTYTVKIFKQGVMIFFVSLILIDNVLFFFCVLCLLNCFACNIHTCAIYFVRWNTYFLKLCIFLYIFVVILLFVFF